MLPFQLQWNTTYSLRVNETYTVCTYWTTFDETCKLIIQNIQSSEEDVRFSVIIYGTGAKEGYMYTGGKNGCYDQDV